jgi:hypothetical protein
MTHLDSLNLRLSNERMRLSKATNCQEISLRTVWIAQLQKEVDSELALILINEVSLTDDELLAELNS